MINKVDLEKLLKSKKISQRTFDKVTIAKQIIERKYNLKTIQNEEMNQIFSKLNSLNISESQKEQIKQEIHSQESAKYRKLREKQSIRDYVSLAIIGRGAFGEVHVCREKKTGQIVAVKKIRKDVLKIKNQVIHVRNEQLFMSKVKSPWIVELKASFQEDDFLYLIMEYLPGGDFMNLLIKKDILTEDEARFYTAELILAIENIHKLDCIHRDIKPDNVLIDKTGHIKLSDFGLAKVSPKIFEINNNINNNENIDFKPETHQKNFSCVGTAYYVAPEVLKKKGYGPEVDWWSVGVIFFEMLFGYAPFHSKETNQVCHKVLNWQKYLIIPTKKKISKEAEDLILKLISNPNQRLGIGGAEEIKKHPFFKGVDWDNIRNTKAPFIPKLKNDYDTHYFETLETKEPFYPNVFNKKQKRKDIEFMGYTFKEGNFDELNLENEILNSLDDLKYINRKQSNGESFGHSSNNSSSNVENGGNNKSNGIENNRGLNNISIHLENEILKENNDENKVLMTKKINKSKNKINKIKINNDNCNYIIYNINNISDKSNILNKQNNILHTISYNNSPQNNNINNNINASSSKKFKKKNIFISQNNANSNENSYMHDRTNLMKNLKTEPNKNNMNNDNNIRNYFEYQNNHNHQSNNNTKLNVIQLPTKKIKDKVSKKIIIQENGASINTSNSNPKYAFKKNLITTSLNKTKYFPHRYSPQPNQPNDIILKQFLISKSKSKKKNWINYPLLSKSSEKGVCKKNNLFKSIINQNAVKKKYIGINSAKSIFTQKKNTQNNNLNNSINSNNDTYYNNNCLTERKYTLNNQNEKISYIYQKKL